MSNVYTEFLKQAEEADKHDILGSVSLALLQQINFWNIKYTDQFVQSSGITRHMYAMDAIMQVNSAIGILSDVMQDANMDGSPEPKYAIQSSQELIQEKIESSVATLVIAAIRIAQEYEIDLGNAVSKEIEVLTGADMGDTLKQAIIKIMVEMANEEKPDEVEAT